MRKLLLYDFPLIVLAALILAPLAFAQCPGGNCPASRAVIRTRSVQFFAQAALPAPAPQKLPVGPGVPAIAVPPLRQTPEPMPAPRIGDVVQRLHEKRMARIERRHEVAVGVVKTAVAVARMPVKAVRAFRFGLRCP